MNGSYTGWEMEAAYFWSNEFAGCRDLACRYLRETSQYCGNHEIDGDYNFRVHHQAEC